MAKSRTSTLKLIESSALDTGLHANLPTTSSPPASVSDTKIFQTEKSFLNVCFILSCIPFLWLLADIAFDNLGANRIQALHVRLGDWSLRFLCITLLITPLQKITRWQGMTPYRQMFGLLSFFYATLHLAAYLWLDHGLAWTVIGIDIYESSYIWFGLIGYTVLFLLAITSSKAAKKIMGKSWKKLHRYIYLGAVTVIFHYFWQLKGNLWQPVFYAIIIAILLFFRVAVWLSNNQNNSTGTAKSKPLPES